MRQVLMPAIIVVLAAAPETRAQTDPLFTSQLPLEITITAPFGELVAFRSRRPTVEGVLSYRNTGGQQVALDLEITTRGHSRLEYCSFPPLSLNLKRGQLDGTVFAGQDKLKLVTQCRPPSQYARYLELEYIAYRIYNEITDKSFRVRPVDMVYIYSDRRNRTIEAPAFLIEHIDGVARRTGLNAVEVESVRADALKQPDLTTFWSFQFLIANTDVADISRSSLEDHCCHNADVLQDRADDSMVVVPFDFDQAGLVDTPYALADERLNIRSVRTRLWRGRCSTIPWLDEVIARFNEARPRIESLFVNDRLDAEERQDALEYLREGYAALNDSGYRESRIEAPCGNR